MRENDGPVAIFSVAFQVLEVSLNSGLGACHSKHPQSCDVGCLSRAQGEGGLVSQKQPRRLCSAASFKAPAGQPGPGSPPSATWAGCWRRLIPSSLSLCGKISEGEAGREVWRSLNSFFISSLICKVPTC